MGNFTRKSDGVEYACCNLIVNPIPSDRRDKINFFIVDFTDIDCVPAPQKLKLHDVFENMAYIGIFVPEQHAAQTNIYKIVFLKRL